MDQSASLQEAPGERLPAPCGRDWGVTFQLDANFWGALPGAKLASDPKATLI